MNELHRRTVHAELELRAKGGKRRLAGYAAVFDTDTNLNPGPGAPVLERVDPAAFDRALSEEQDVRALVDHDSRLILGRTSAGTLRLGTDKHGLHFEVDLPETSTARDLAVSMERGDITGASFGFIPREWNFDIDEDRQTLLDLDLFDVGPVTFPAYAQTEVAVRSFLARADEARARTRWAEIKARFDGLTAPTGA